MDGTMFDQIHSVSPCLGNSSFSKAQGKSLRQYSRFYHLIISIIFSFGSALNEAVDNSHGNVPLSAATQMGKMPILERN